jgi:serine/threonine protein kinase
MKEIKRRSFTFANVKLGAGSFSNVLKATHKDKATGKCTELACKYISKEKNDKSFVKQYLPREIAIIKKLSQRTHPNIIGCHSLYETQKFVLIFLRWAINGTLLSQINETGGLPEVQAKVWIKQVAEGITHLHRMQIVHRDIKAENVLISKNMTAKITDFGFAKDYSKERIAISTESCGSKRKKLLS